ncbi:hypothetical protein BH11BAC7_BH11BAC7_33810 [soil metagenome]
MNTHFSKTHKNNSKSSAHNLSDDKGIGRSFPAAGNTPGVTQLVRDGFYDGTARAGELVPRNRITFAAAFQNKHFAADAARAQTTTRARVQAVGCPAGILNGTLPNTTATPAEWKDAVYDSQTTMPDVDAWTGNVNVAVNGWQTTYTRAVQPPQVDTYPTVALAAGNLTVGGYLPTQGGVLRIDHVGN